MMNSRKHLEPDELNAYEYDCLEARLGQVEERLVQEFRACQALQSLTREERQALTNVDVSRLAGLVEEKEALLDQFGRIEDERRQITMAISPVIWPSKQDQIAGGYAAEYTRDPAGERTGKHTPENLLPSLREILKALQGLQARPAVVQLASQLGRLQEGILALALAVRELNSGNIALANAAIERTAVVQAFLLNRMPPAASYQPPGAPRGSQPSLVWDVDVGNTNNLGSSIDSSCKTTTRPFDGVADAHTANGNPHRQVRTAAEQMEMIHNEIKSLLSLKEDINLAEANSILHYQESIYQAVLEVGNRAIAAMSLFDYLS